MEMKNLQNSTLSLRSVPSFAPSIKTNEAMKQLCGDLYRVGVDKAVAIF